MQARVSKDDSDQVRYRLNIASRTVLAVLGGYAVSALYAASLSLALPLPRAQAVLAATMLAFIVYCTLCIWAFCAASARRAWVAFLVLAALPALHLWMAGAGQ